MSNNDCLMCHEDPELTAEDGRLVGVNLKSFNASVHQSLSCTDCHSQPGNFDEFPHFQVYQKVNCAECHDDDAHSFEVSFHGRALAAGNAKAPDCCACHGDCGDSHAIGPLNLRSAENSCRQCHFTEAKRYDGSVHSIAAKKGKGSPGCVSCHPTHSEALPPSVGAINNLCVGCHPGAMQAVTAGGHAVGVQAQGKGAMSCASCHDVHATHKPHLDTGTLQACNTCHPGYLDQFDGSVHAVLINDSGMNCLSCHRSHQVTDAAELEDFGCGACHDAAEKEYRTSAHRLARLRGDQAAATCADCHGGHHVLSPADTLSPVNHRQIPKTCGSCHTDESVITSDYVRLPISLPNYSESVHGTGWVGNKRTAVCSDCHGFHHLQSASSPTSTISKSNLATTCGKCHKLESREYVRSVHGKALAHGISDSPSCTDCHDEHLIFKVSDPRSKVHPGIKASQTCASCHENPEMAARYGLPPDVVESYQDSYHGWAVKRGGAAVASCVDCHNTHLIGSLLDPESSIHPDNVVMTCARCHSNANATFAASYTHILARGKLMVHDWVRIAYIILIVLVLGGMAGHNLLIYGHDLKAHYQKVKSEPSIMRMNASEIVQHIILAVTFFGLAGTGFALRFPDAWWVKLLTDMGLNEESRRITHRVLALALVTASLYHLYYLMLTQRGRMLLKALFPRIRDAAQAVQNIGYYLGLRKHHPGFGMFDYTQKAEYWALIWGTALMSITGFVLWFPALATGWLPAWVVRVCEVIHFYEAILAVSAIIIWHFYYTIFAPKQYPMSWIWITGRMPKEEWESHHSEAAAEENAKV